MNIMEATTFQTAAVKTFSHAARKFLLNLIAQRRKLTITGQGRIQKKMATEAIGLIHPYLVSYNYSDAQMARFITTHFNTIMLILPGKGSSCHESRLKEMMKIYDQALQINTNKEMIKYTYYRVSSDHGEGYIKTSQSSCSVASLRFDGKAEIRQYDAMYKRFNGEVTAEITADKFREGCRKVLDVLKKDLGLC